MQSEGTILAEARCLKKHHSIENEFASGNLHSRDVEKAEVTATDAPATGPPLAGTIPNLPSGPNGIFEQSSPPDSDNLSVTSDEKDDFPEGGLRG